MSVSGTQTLTLSGGGAGGKYTWSTDYGTFDSPIGASVNFTAPSANANCANNPTITLTDCCGHKATLKIAVNGYPGGNPCGQGTCSGYGVPYAYQKTTGGPTCVVIAVDNCQCQYPAANYGCDGAYVGCSSTISGSYCRVSYPPLSCSVGLCAPSITTDLRIGGVGACMKTAGCCPAALL